jgi:hypothetical protein
MFSKLFKLHIFLTAYLSHRIVTRLTIKHTLLTLPSVSGASHQGGRGVNPHTVYRAWRVALFIYIFNKFWVSESTYFLGYLHIPCCFIVYSLWFNIKIDKLVRNGTQKKRLLRFYVPSGTRQWGLFCSLLNIRMMIWYSQRNMILLLSLLMLNNAWCRVNAEAFYNKSIHRRLVMLFQKKLWFLRLVCRIGLTPLTWLRDCGRTSVWDKRVAWCRSCPWPRPFHTSRESTGWRPIKRVISGEMLPSPIPLQRRFYLLPAAVIILQSEPII